MLFSKKSFAEALTMTSKVKPKLQPYIEEI